MYERPPPHYDESDNPLSHGGHADATSPHSQSRQQAEYGVDPSSLPDNEQISFPMTSSLHITPNPTKLTPGLNSFDSEQMLADSEKTLVETHSGKKRHRCDICGSYWGRPSSLRIHMVSHTGVKGVSWSIFSGLQSTLYHAQSSCVPSVSVTLG